MNDFSIITPKKDLELKISKDEKIVSVIKWPETKGNTNIPESIEHEKQNIKITSIGTYAFYKKEIQSLTFSQDSAVDTFENKCFYYSHIIKLQIPPKLKYLKDCWCLNLYDLNTIEISPDNKNFTYYNNKFLLGKSDEETEEFDLLRYAKFNLISTIIPPQVQIIKRNSFYRHPYLKAIKFTNDSKVKIIESFAFSSTPIKILVLPSSIENIEGSCFKDVPNLKKIKIKSSENIINDFYSVVDKKILLKKISIENKIFYNLVCVVRNIESIEISSNIIEINEYAFNRCELLNSIKFELNSFVEKIGNYAFSFIAGPKLFVLPESVNDVGFYAMSHIINVEEIRFLGKSLKIGGFCFSLCPNLSVVSFPNAIELVFKLDSFYGINENTKVEVNENAKITGEGVSKILKNIVYIPKKS